jgi:putative hydrolase of the HAD superfamily
MVRWVVIKHLLLDLDETLYPPTARIGAEISKRIVCFTAGLLGVSFEEAWALREKRGRQFGTTLEWLQTEHGLGGADRLERAHEYLRFVHPAHEAGEVDFDPRLRPFLQGLRLPMTILTNSPVFHAERVLRVLRIEDLFLGIWDIVKSDLRGKPHPDAYAGALSLSGYSMEDTLFADDYGKYVKGYMDLGGRAVLVSAKAGEIEKAPGAPHIDSIYEIEKLL